MATERLNLQISVILFIVGCISAPVDFAVAHPVEFNTGDPRGLTELDWSADHIKRTITAGIPSSLEIEAFFDREQPKIQTIDGHRCVVANFLAFDVDDDFAFNIDEKVTIELLIDRSTAGKILYMYDRNGAADVIGEVPAPLPVENRWQKVKIELDRARFANRGMAGTDIAMTAEATFSPTPGDDATLFTLCSLKIIRSNTTIAQKKYGELSVRLLGAKGSNQTSARVGIYDAANRAVLPGEDAIGISYYDKNVKHLKLRSLVDPRQYWPAESRYFFYVDGNYSNRLPVGEYTIVVAKGPEYHLISKKFQVAEGGETILSILLERWNDMPAKGWYSGDMHIHIDPALSDSHSISRLLQAEDVHVSSLLEVSNVATSHFRQPAWGSDGQHREGEYTTVPGVEGPRTALRGHTISVPVSAPMVDQDSYFLYHHFLEHYAQQGALTGYAHVGSEEFNASWGLALDVPFGLIDFVEVMQNSQLRTEFWYEFLNLGYHLAPAAGSDFPYFDQPGAVRSYAKIDGSFSTEKWFDALRAGHTFVSNGPMLELSVDGQPMGRKLHVSEGSTVEVTASARVNPDFDSLDGLELLVCGDVVKRVARDSNLSYELTLKERLTVDSGMWVAIRAVGDRYTLAHSAPIYIHTGNGFTGCADKAEETVANIKHRLDKLSRAEIQPHRELEYWEIKDLAMIYERQRPELLERIESAHALYDELLDTIEAHP